MDQPIPTHAPGESVRPRFFDSFDLWDTEEKLIHARGALGGLRANDRPDGSHSDAIGATLGSERATVDTKPVLPEATLPWPDRAVKQAVWATDKAAVVLVTCGIVVLVWSWLAGRPDLQGAGWATSTLGVLVWLAGCCMSLTCRPPLRSGGRFS